MKFYKNHLDCGVSVAEGIKSFVEKKCGDFEQITIKILFDHTVWSFEILFYQQTLLKCLNL